MGPSGPTEYQEHQIMVTAIVQYRLPPEHRPIRLR